MDDSDFEELCGVADFDGVEDDAGEPETAAAVAAPPASKPTPAVATEPYRKTAARSANS